MVDEEAGVVPQSVHSYKNNGYILGSGSTNMNQHRRQRKWLAEVEDSRGMSWSDFFSSPVDLLWHNRYGLSIK